MGVEYTDDPHPRNTYWEMWGQPDVRPQGRGRRHDGAERAAARLFRDHYIKLNAFDSYRMAARSMRMSFIVNRPKTSQASGWTQERGAMAAHVRYATLTVGALIVLRHGESYMNVHEHRRRSQPEPPPGARTLAERSAATSSVA